jgi:3-hydroxybutyryl-CoA dehydrogenase
VIEKIAVLGAGQMGSGIAHVAALAGYQVELVDVSTAQLEKAAVSIDGNLERQLKKNLITALEREKAKARIVYGDKVRHSAVQLVIEAVSENITLKQQVLHHVIADINADCILATNTSSISITQLAAATDRPEKVVGLHFMNPVPVMQLVEVIRGLATSDATFEAMEKLVSRLNKTMVISKDYPGFIVNRILMPMINEAIYALYEGVATVEDIDIAMKLGTNQPMGPLALADLIGLDTCLSIMQVLHRGFGDSKYRPCPLLINYVNAGWLGRKNGKGFYSYT